ncbi:MAG: superoxide dismutase family protein [Clostridia bacterium]|nr:superoxide dismutase family protein [Clostridia bacterium]
MNKNSVYPRFGGILRRRPTAQASVRGSDRYPEIYGTVEFYETPFGVMVAAQISGLPSPVGDCYSPVFGFHIHGGGSCTGNADDPFANAGMHYDPRRCPHPYHAGDLPPLFGADGYAFSMFLTDRFTVDEIIGKTVIIHSRPDDFTTQPSGNSGVKMACGRIERL